MIRLGVCTAASNAEILAEAGFDYLEESFRRTVEYSEAELASARSALNAAGIRAEAYNCLLPTEPRLLGDGASASLYDEYLKRGFDRAAELGGRVAVFGSGKARRIPDGMSRNEAYDRLADFCAHAAALAEQVGMQLVIEPLRASECNAVNFVTDALELTRRAGYPAALGAHADLYHMAEGGERMANLVLAGKRLYHCHIAEPISRGICRDGAYGEIYASFFGTLKAIGYRGRISFEGGGFSPETAKPLCKTLRSFL